jgi:thymidylate synthase (FAD)
MASSFVRLVDHMGDDASIVQAARVSYGPGTKTVSDDRALIRYLMRHQHSSPFEMVEFKFHVRVPIFVARQWLRHRTASVNEVSARYSIVKDDFFVPSELRAQSKTAGQGSSGEVITEELLRLKQKASCDLAFHTYDELVRRGVARELARAHLPQSTFTEFYWKLNLHNLFHFLKLRISPGAQPEIREPAQSILEILKSIVPLACEAFQDYVLDAVVFSGPEIRALQTGDTSTLAKSEQKEFATKKTLGLVGEC